MLHQFKFPEVEGLASKDLTLLRYYVKEQQKVNEGDPIAFVDMGIATVDVPADKEGIVKTLHVPVGGVFQCGDPVFTLITYSESESTRSVTRWEYDTIPLGDTGLFGKDGIDTQALKTKLDALGKKGWELATSIDTGTVGKEASNTVLVLKRRIWI
jgi:pyruvate/2-oxoglutarate dehydrogenase complex dihydrolipoamide acyltransferase (E2) component